MTLEDLNDPDYLQASYIIQYFANRKDFYNGDLSKVVSAVQDDLPVNTLDVQVAYILEVSGHQFESRTLTLLGLFGADAQRRCSASILSWVADGRKQPEYLKVLIPLAEHIV